MFTRLEPPLSNSTPKKHGSTFGVNDRFRSNIQTKQEAVDSLNSFNDTVLITVMFLSALQPNTKFYISKR